MENPTQRQAGVAGCGLGWIRTESSRRDASLCREESSPSDADSAGSGGARLRARLPDHRHDFQPTRDAEDAHAAPEHRRARAAPAGGADGVAARRPLAAVDAGPAGDVGARVFRHRAARRAGHRRRRRVLALDAELVPDGDARVQGGGASRGRRRGRRATPTCGGSWTARGRSRARRARIATRATRDAGCVCGGIS